MAEAAVFGEYARYYELLYRDKDYAGEARFVRDVIERHAPGARSLLELGCGGGRHAALFAAAGLSVTGVERSAAMLDAARALAGTLPVDEAARLSFVQADIREAQAGGPYDAACALFHVMSYQTADADLRAAFGRAAAHLRPGGVFVFDCWHGPCVLAEPPQVRVRRMEDERTRVVRVCEPDWDREVRVVTVNYEIFVEDKAGGQIRSLREAHPMRYLFEDEVRGFMVEAGLELAERGEWLTGREPGPDTFGVYYVGRKAA